MSKLDLFTQRIISTLENLTRERATRERALAAEMDHAVDSLQRFAPLADAIHHLEIRPRLDALTSNFSNATVEHWLSATGIVSHCTFARTPQYPANVKLTLSIEHEPAQQHTALRYKLEIIPQLMRFEHGGELTIDATSPDMAEIVEWIERTLESFLATYVRLESDPNYQKENHHVDQVCGMHVQAGLVSHTAEYSHHTYHFCSPECRERFVASPDLFVGGCRRPLTAH